MNTHPESAAPPRRKTTRRNGPRVEPIAEPIEIAKFWANRRGEAVIVSLTSWKDRPLFDVRKYYTDKDGLFAPTSRGIKLALQRLPELLDALRKAHDRAVELGLLKPEADR